MDGDDMTTLDVRIAQGPPAATEADAWPVSDSGEREYTHVCTVVTASGDTTVYTPTTGKKVRLRWIYAINDPSSTNPPLITVKLGTQEKYKVYALSKRQRVTGPTNGALIINLAGGGNVAVTAILEEVT